MPTAAELKQLCRQQYPDDFATWERDYRETPYEHYFLLLEVTSDSVTLEEEIEKNYRRLIRDGHPDTGAAGSSTAYASILNRAHETLKNKHTRRGYLLFLQYLATEKHEQQQGATGGTGSGQAHTTPGAEPQRLEIEPAGYTPSAAVPLGTRVPVTLRLRATGEPCNEPPFRLRTPRHPRHPRPDAHSWLSIEGPEPRSIGREWSSVQVMIDTTRLRPETTYTEQLFIDFCGQEFPWRASFTTGARVQYSGMSPFASTAAGAAPGLQPVTRPARPAVRRSWVLAGVAAVVLVLAGKAMLASGGGSNPPQPAAAPSRSAGLAPAPTQPPPTQAPTPPPTEAPIFVQAAGGGTCPPNYPVKINTDGQAFGLNSPNYNSVSAMRCYDGFTHAVADGFTQVTTVPSVAQTQAPARTQAPAQARPQTTQAPAQDALADTPPGTVLRVHGTWVQGGIALTLRTGEAGIPNGEPGILIGFTITNTRPNPVIMQFPLSAITVTDNLGRTPPAVISFGCGSTPIVQLSLTPKQSVNFPDGCTGVLFAKDDVTSSQLTEVTVIATGISSITNARWTIPVEH